MKNTIYLSLALLCLAWNAAANGGPIDGSAVYKAGNVVLMSQPDIKLLKEDLHIEIDGDYSWVHVVYQLQSNASKDVDITYGFPIEIVEADIENSLTWRDEYVPEISFLLDGGKLPIKHRIDSAMVKSDAKRRYGSLKKNARRSWFVVDFHIKKEQKVSLAVKYKVKSGYVDWAYSKSFYPVFKPRMLVYDFTPAAHWGDGKIGILNVTVDARKQVANRESVKLEGIVLTDREGIYSTSISNFELTKAENLNIIYSNTERKLSEYIQQHRVASDKIKSIKASSTLKGKYSYEAVNLLDGNLNTAWAEGKRGHGVGEKIEIELNDYKLGAICIINGYTKSEGTFITNSKVKKLKVELEYVDYSDPPKTAIESSEVLFEDLLYMKTSDENRNLMIDRVIDLGDGFLKVRKITLTILEVFEGTKYTDTCISEIYLLGYEQ